MLRHEGRLSVHHAGDRYADEAAEKSSIGQPVASRPLVVPIRLGGLISPERVLGIALVIEGQPAETILPAPSKDSATRKVHPRASWRF